MHFYLFTSLHALREVDQNPIRIKLRFYRQTGKSDSTLYVKLAGEIFQVLTYIRLFYKTKLLVGRVGMLVLFFGLCLQPQFIQSEPVYPGIFSCDFDHFQSCLL